MVEEIRVMWCDALEELLQCPVCLDTTQGVKIQCINGHHICNECRVQLHTCPICKSGFIGTRNLAVEQISAKLEDIKLSLLNPYHALNRRVLKNKVCVATQTDTCMPSTSSGCQTEPVNQAKPLNNEPKSVNLAPRVGKGLYPCRIGSCVMELPHGRIIGHLRYHHKDIFYEFAAKDAIFKKNWNLEYILNRDYDYAFHIKDMGLFFMNISIHQVGNLIASLQIVNCNAVGKQFTYTFETTGATLNRCYTGVVKSCRVGRETLRTDCLRIHENNMRNMVDNKNFFHCNLTIKRMVNYRTLAAQNNTERIPEVFGELFNN